MQVAGQVKMQHNVASGDPTGFDICIEQARIQDFGRGGGAWGVGDKLAVRSSQVCVPGGSEGLKVLNFRCIFLQFGAYFIQKLFCLPIFCR